uniref:I-set domain-containing protein n=1 Tax=Gongylonema pulchrum TaxID=637853 RepID=A0A183DIT4_9BILA
LHATPETRVEEEISRWHRVLIENTRPEHSGMYTVIAENEAGEARSGATLNVESRRTPMEQKGRTVVQSRVGIEIKFFECFPM